jgi:hypothetical protein
MSANEITNGQISESFPLLEVADQLQARDDDSTRARLLNHVSWETVSPDDWAIQSAVNKLMRAKGWQDGPDARVHIEDTALRDIDDAEGYRYIFRVWHDADSVLHTSVFSLWLDPTVESSYPAYREDLDLTVTDEADVRAARGKLFDDNGMVPLYDDGGWVRLSEDGQKHLGVKHIGDADLDLDAMVDGADVLHYQNWTVIARHDFGETRAAQAQAGEYHDMLWTLANPTSKRTQARKAQAMFVPGMAPTVPGSRVRTKRADAEPVKVKPARQSVVKRTLRRWLAE